MGVALTEERRWEWGLEGKPVRNILDLEQGTGQGHPEVGAASVFGNVTSPAEPGNGPVKESAGNWGRPVRFIC